MSRLFCAASEGFPWGRKSLSEGCRMNSEIFPSGPVGPKGRFRSSTGSPRRVISGLAEVPRDTEEYTGLSGDTDPLILKQKAVQTQDLSKTDILHAPKPSIERPDQSGNFPSARVRPRWAAREAHLWSGPRNNIFELALPLDRRFRGVKFVCITMDTPRIWVMRRWPTCCSRRSDRWGRHQNVLGAPDSWESRLRIEL